jgi:OmpA-OmpF porin, OOP family
MKKLIAAALLSAASLGAFAQGGYMGVGFGQGKADIEDFDVSPFTLTEDETANAFKVFGGVEINPGFAVEFGYQQFGTFNQTVSGAGGTISGDYEGSGFFADLIGRLPVNESFSVHGKVGLAYTTLDFSCKSQTGVFAGLCSGESESEMNLRFGLGAQVRINEQAALRFEFERTIDVGKEDTTGESDIDYLGVGVVFRF